MAKQGNFHRKELFLDEKIFILKNYATMKYDDILKHINGNRSLFNQLAYSTLRHRIKDLGLSRYKYIQWAGVHEKFLKKNYKTKGNKELATILSSNKFRSKKKFTRHQVSKKMELLNLHRTSEELAFVVKRNLILGIMISVIPKYTKQRILINKFNKDEQRRNDESDLYTKRIRKYRFSYSNKSLG